MTGLVLDATISQRSCRYPVRGAHRDWQSSVRLGEYPEVWVVSRLENPQAIGKISCDGITN